MVRLARNDISAPVSEPRITTMPVNRLLPQRAGTDPAAHAYWLLRIGFTVAPIVAGLDKFTNLLVDWSQYLAPWAANLFGGAYPFMYAVGVVEIVAGLGVAIMPRVFAYVVSAWLLGIVISLITFPGYYDIALRDFGLALGALALARLSAVYPRPMRASD